MADDALLDTLRASLPAMLSDLESLVVCESPSADLEAVARSADAVGRLGSRLLGQAPERLVIEGRTHLRWRLGEAPARVLLLGHHDTVWPVGTLATHPFTVVDGVVRGPGCFDMLAGVVVMFHAVAASGRPAGVTILLTGDEEIGSPTSRALIEAEASDCAAALVLEASGDAGALKTERKGVSIYDVQVLGRAAHAGLEPERGINATIELAHQVLAIGALADPERGTTVTPTAMASGTTTNTVPALGRVAVDVRVRELAEQLRVDEAMKALSPVQDGARLLVEGGPNRPPLEPHASAALFARATGIAERLRLAPLTAIAVGGASDGNFTAGIGTPTLDGLGAVGGGAHAADEHVLAASLPERTALLALLVQDLTSAAAWSGRTNNVSTAGAQ